MVLSRILLLEFGVFLILLVPMVLYKLARHWVWERKNRPAIDAGEWVLLAGTSTIALRYLLELVSATRATMPGLGTGWLWMFGACCAAFASMKWMKIGYGKRS